MVLTTHLFLVHDEMIPNITPALDPSFRPKEVYLLCSQESINQTERLEILLKQTGIAVFRWPVNDPWDIEHIRERVLEFVVNHDHIDIALNVTGGTKPMSLAAYEVFKNMAKPVYYVQTDRDYVVWLNPRDRESFDLADRIKLPAYFTAYGMRISSLVKEPVSEKRRALTLTLIQNVSHFAKPLTILNGLASLSFGTLISPPLNKAQIRQRDLQNLLALFTSQDMVKIDNKNQLHFPAEDARFYVNGGWLEEHVYSVLFRVTQEISSIQDFARNVKIEWDINGSSVCNEIDVACLADNHLHIIECKTRNFDNTNMATQDLYKLNTLQNYLGGAQAKAMVISYHRFTDVALLRADELNIAICDQERICDLDNILKYWFKKQTS